MNDIPPQSTHCITNYTMLKLHERNKIFTNQVIYRKFHYTTLFAAKGRKKEAIFFVAPTLSFSTFKSAVLTKDGLWC